MPRKGRGGSRQGTPGTAYKNRTDLAADRAPAQPARAPQGQDYGERGAQEAALQQVPLPDLAAQLQALPGLTDPSQRPDEPLTAGLPFGPGPGPATPPVDRSGAGILRRLVAENPDPELFALLELAERSQGGVMPRSMMPQTQGGVGVSSGRVAAGVTSDEQFYQGVGSPAGNRAGYAGLPTGGRAGRISAREGMA